MSLARMSADSFCCVWQMVWAEDLSLILVRITTSERLDLASDSRPVTLAVCAPPAFAISSALDEYRLVPDWLLMMTTSCGPTSPARAMAWLARTL